MKKKAKVAAKPKGKVVRAAAVAPPTATLVNTLVDTQQHYLSLSARDTIIKGLANSFNDGANRRLVRANEIPNGYALRRPTGIIEIDIDIGGGFPAGGMGYIGGPESAGKTWMLLKMMAMQQRIYGDACRMVYVMTEAQFPHDVAARVGLRLEYPDHMINQWNAMRNARGIPNFTKEELLVLKTEVGKTLFVRDLTGEGALKVILECARSNAFSLIGCDSEQGLRPEVEADRGLNDNEVRAAHANMMGKFFKHYIPTTLGCEQAIPNQTTVIFLKQVRANQERSNAPAHLQQYIKPWATSTSWAGKHYALINLIINDGKTLKKDGSDGRVAVGKMMHWLVEKGKAGTHDNKTGEVPFYYNICGTDDANELITSGIKRGVIQQDSRVHVVTADTGAELTDMSCADHKEMYQLITTNVSYEWRLRTEILNAAGIQCLYR